MILPIAVFCTFLIALSLLGLSLWKTFSFGRRKLFSEERGEKTKGIAYALGKGMLPWEKESASRHLATYIGGVVYHAGVFVAIGYVLWLAAGGRLAGWLLTFLQIALSIGLVSGLALLIKRVVKPSMRAISCADDFIANILVDVLLLIGLISTLYSGWVPFYFVAACVLFIYTPLGKIRHCFYFFYSRILFGSYFGRRAVFPHNQHSYGGKR